MRDIQDTISMNCCSGNKLTYTIFLWEVAEPRMITFRILVLFVAYQKS